MNRDCPLIYTNCIGKLHDKCDEQCFRYKVITNMYFNSGIPKKYKYTFINTLDNKGEDAKVYKMTKNYIDKLHRGEKLNKGFFFYSSTTGNGKTALACAIANEFMLEAVIQLKLKTIPAMYMVVPTFLDMIKATFNGDTTYDIYEYINKLKTCNILVIDDIGAEKPSEFTRERLYTIIQERYNQGLPTIITSNHSLPQLKEQVGNRIVSRIMETCYIYKFIGPDRRINL